LTTAFYLDVMRLTNEGNTAAKRIRHGGFGAVSEQESSIGIVPGDGHERP